MESESETNNGAGIGSSPSACSPLGKLHKWWLREFGHHTKLMVDYSYAGTPYAKALIGLMNRRLIKFVVGFEGAGLVELTPEGIAAKESLANSKAGLRWDDHLVRLL